MMLDDDELSKQYSQITLLEMMIWCCIKIIFPDHITKNDMAIDESIGESSYQYCLQVHLRNCTLVFFPFFLTNCLQWLFYLILVSAAVKTRIAPRAATKITFDSLLFSSITSITCLSLGQFKVWLGQFQNMFVLFLQANSVMTEYSTSIAQKIIYIFACLGKHSKSKWQNSTTSIIMNYTTSTMPGDSNPTPPASTISTQLLVTNFFLALTDLPMPDDLVSWF